VKSAIAIVYQNRCLAYLTQDEKNYAFEICVEQYDLPTCRILRFFPFKIDSVSIHSNA